MTVDDAPFEDRVARLLRKFAKGDRVVAALDIYYGVGPEVAEGARGTVVASSNGGVVYVRWDGVAFPLGTSADSIDPEPSS